MPTGGEDVSGDVWNSGTNCTSVTELPTPICAAITAYTRDTAGNFVATPTNQLSSKLKIGDVVRFGVRGANGTFTRGRFSINGAAPIETATKAGDDFVYDYTITSAGAISVTAEVFVQ